MESNGRQRLKKKMEEAGIRDDSAVIKSYLYAAASFSFLIFFIPFIFPSHFMDIQAKLFVY